MNPSEAATAQIAGQTISTVGYCQYTVDYPASATRGDPTVHHVFLGSYKEPLGNVYALNTNNPQPYSSQVCDTFTVLRWPGEASASAQQNLDSGYCNTDYTDIWGSVQVVNTGAGTGPKVYEGKFHYWFMSNESGKPLEGVYENCLEDPAGQHDTYTARMFTLARLFR
ncbi:MAG: hypothetical protein ACRDZ5_00840 [Acidimicrobiales bacterium]